MTFLRLAMTQKDFAIFIIALAVVIAGFISLQYDFVNRHITAISYREYTSPN